MTGPSRLSYRGAGGFTGMALAGIFQSRMHDVYEFGRKQSNDADTLSYSTVGEFLIGKIIGRSCKIFMPF